MRKTYVIKDGVLVEKNPENSRQFHEVMPDIKPYKSMITGEMITSRSQHREHLHKHGYQEVGNDSSLRKPHRIPDTNPEQRKELLRHQVNSFTNKQWEKMGKEHRKAVIHHMERFGED